MLRAVRFHIWVAVLRARMRRRGMALRVQGIAGWASAPHVDIDLSGGRGGSLTLRLGRECSLGRGLVIVVRSGADSALELAQGARLASWCAVHLRGGTIRLGEHADVRDHVLLKAAAGLDVGRRTVLSRASTVHADGGVRIGDEVGLGERTTVIDSDHTFDGDPPGWIDRPLRIEPIEIGNGALVGANCVLRRGSRIGPGAAVAAGSVVGAGEYPAGWLVAGAPAEAVREL